MWIALYNTFWVACFASELPGNFFVLQFLATMYIYRIVINRKNSIFMLKRVKAKVKYYVKSEEFFDSAALYKYFPPKF